MPIATPNYHLLEKIGEGGFGEVWLAETVTGKLRAVKIVHRQRFQRPGLSVEEIDALFEREFEGVQRFEDLASQHPSLIDVQHVGRDPDGDFYYYTMPLADNALDADSARYDPLSLERRLLRDGPLDWDEALELMRELGGGLDRLHRDGLCHGDVTSANVLFVDDRPVLADPGLTADTSRERLTRSPGFSDPSPTAGTTPRGDVFALGRLLYHVLTGLHPAESFPLVPADRLRVLPAEALADLLDRCCDPEPTRRFADAGEFLGSLHPELPAQSPEPARPWRRRLVIAASIAGLAILSAVVLASKRQPPVPDLVKIEDNRLTAYTSNPLQALWSTEMESICQAELVDLDLDGTPEVVCALRHQNPAKRDGGSLVVLKADGSPHWSFETTQKHGNYFKQGSHALGCYGFLACDWDASRPGVEVVVVARNATGWFPTALQFLDAEGSHLATWWHPGHVYINNLRFVRETPESPPFLTVSGYNNSLSRPVRELPPGKQWYRSFFALLDPRIPGEHGAPPGSGKLGGRDSMTRCYRLIDPQWARCRPVIAQDIDGDGRNELRVWSEFGNRDEFPHERINQFDYYRFDGERIETGFGDGHQVDARHLPPGEFPERKIGEKAGSGPSRRDASH